MRRHFVVNGVRVELKVIRTFTDLATVTSVDSAWAQWVPSERKLEVSGTMPDGTSVAGTFRIIDQLEDGTPVLQSCSDTLTFAEVDADGSEEAQSPATGPDRHGREAGPADHRVSREISCEQRGSEMKQWLWKNVLVIAFIIVFVTFVCLAASLWHPRADLMQTFISAVATVLAAIAAFGSWFTVHEMRIDRAERNRPWVLLEFPFNSLGAVYCHLRNMGPGLARNVTLEFDPVPVDFKGRKLTDLPIFQNPIPILSPGAEIRQFFHVGHKLFDKTENKNMPLRFTATVKYEGEGGFREPGAVYHIDLEQYRGVTLPPTTVEEHLGKLERHLRQLVSRLKGISTLNSLIVESRREYQERVERQIRGSEAEASSESQET